MIPLVIVSLFLCEILGNSAPVESSGLEKQRNMNKRIVEGYPVESIDEFPWIASIYTNNLHFCSGSILSTTVILTAAHCAIEYPSDSLSIRVGSARVHEGGSKHDLDELKVHENYTQTLDFVWNDLALMKVKPPIEFSLNVMSVLLPTAGKVITPGTEVSVAGWGRTHEDGDKSKSLMYTNLRIVDYDKCSREYEAVSDTFMKSHGLICAAAPDTGACKGDSGGPLMIGSLQVGIVSFNRRGCASQYYSDIYTDVSFHIDWINKNIVNYQAPVTTQKPTGTTPITYNSFVVSPNVYGESDYYWSM